MLALLDVDDGSGLLNFLANMADLLVDLHWRVINLNIVASQEEFQLDVALFEVRNRDV